MEIPTEEEVRALAEKLTPEILGSLIDHTNLSPIASHAAILELCEQAKSFGAGSVCINADYVLFVRRELKDSKVRVCAVVGFPLGADTPRVKAAAADEAFANGAHEVDMVIDIASALEQDYEDVRKGIREVILVRDSFNRRHDLRGKDRRLVKVIVETCYLMKKELIQEVCRVAKEEGADFVKSSTGFGQPSDANIPKGATVEFIRWMREAVGPYDAVSNPIGVKAAGGVGTARQALQMLIAAGILDAKGNLVSNPEQAVRIGASKGQVIMEDFLSRYVRHEKHGNSAQAGDY